MGMSNVNLRMNLSKRLADPHYDLRRAVVIAEQFFRSIISEGYLDKYQEKVFDMSNIKVKDLIGYIAKYHDVGVTVNLYTSKWPWSAATAYMIPSDPYNIYLNTRHLKREISSLVATLVHEFIHCLEAIVKKDHPWIFFNHGNNSPTNKEDTAQYWMDYMAARYAESIYGII